MRASGAAVLRGPEPAQSVQPAPDPGAQETLQHGGQAMGPSPQQAAETKGLTCVHKLFSFCFLSPLCCICPPAFITVSLPSVCSASLLFSAHICLFCQWGVDSYLMALCVMDGSDATAVTWLEKSKFYLRGLLQEMASE